MKRRDLIKTLAGIALATGVPSVFATKNKQPGHFEGEPIYGSKGVRLVDPDELEGAFDYNQININYLSHEEAETAGYSVTVEGPETVVTMQELNSFVEEEWTCAGPDVVEAIRNGGW